MASAGAPARAYNWGLGAEPPTEVQGAESPVGGQGAMPPEADEVFMVALCNRADHYIFAL